jgi:hypothetical protein
LQWVSIIKAREVYLMVLALTSVSPYQLILFIFSSYSRIGWSHLLWRIRTCIPQVWSPPRYRRLCPSSPRKRITHHSLTGSKSRHLLRHPWFCTFVRNRHFMDIRHLPRSGRYRFPGQLDSDVNPGGIRNCVPSLSEFLSDPFE